MLVYSVWTCLKAMTQSKTLKEEPSQKKLQKNYNNDKYNLW